MTWKSIDKVYDAILQLEAEFLYYLDQEQLKSTADRMYNRFGIQHLSLGVNGTHIQFEEGPRDIPDFHVKQHYNNRKNFYSLNAMVVANDERIVHVDATWLGTDHNA